MNLKRGAQTPTGTVALQIMTEEASEPKTTLSRLRRYAPLIGWMTLIFFASTGEFSAANTNLLVKPLLRWLFPHITNEGITAIHFLLRKCGHFTGYAILGFLAARAFSAASHARLRHHWFVAGLILVCLYALSDEFHQSFVATRTASLHDSLIDMSGGVLALIFVAAWRTRRRRAPKTETVTLAVPPA